jgi:hypothetical protein
MLKYLKLCLLPVVLLCAPAFAQVVVVPPPGGGTVPLPPPGEFSLGRLRADLTILSRTEPWRSDFCFTRPVIRVIDGGWARTLLANLDHTLPSYRYASTWLQQPNARALLIDGSVLRTGRSVVYVPWTDMGPLELEIPVGDDPDCGYQMTMKGNWGGACTCTLKTVKCCGSDCPDEGDCGSCSKSDPFSFAREICPARNAIAPDPFADTRPLTALPIGSYL